MPTRPRTGVTMGEQDPHRRAAQYRLERLDEDSDVGGPGDGRARDAGPRARPEPADDPVASGPRPRGMAARAAFADELVRQAMARGEWDDLPLAGKPIPGIGGRYDPDWWLKSLIEREQITGVLPEALQLRKDDAALDGVLDRQHGPEAVREALEEFNARIIAARRQLRGGPPVVTPLRDVAAEVDRWRARREARVAQAIARSAEQERVRAEEAARRADGRWWRRVARRARATARSGSH
ncbi:DUF1992 domain-containing protein [uncultured Cellulomonas sp.]|uniref:DnaJ family domain-containing protein n=1 Tax=uncultured Cellulomonas sp. TaxID=189682 RepID=UPI0026349C2F|nr:DUF1992 domain-containing protein [uncultured Cellulomonas sp.]